MKTFILICSVIVFTFVSSCKKEHGQDAIVVQNCLGYYLRINAEDYYICNQESMKDYADGDAVVASVMRTERCNPSGVCLIVHPTAGYVTVQEIK
tara:strand:+ start:91879 stop:92163 length:285 start_codon:yes stop_codon:yes gene_type:complete